MTAEARTILHDRHIDLGARMVPFAGWSMPVQYTGVIEEHRAVREGAGMFDVSHMGTVLVSGEGAAAALDRLTTWPMSTLEPGRARYTVFLTDDGGCIDDLIVYRRAAAEWLIIWNAANHGKDLAWAGPAFAAAGAHLDDRTAGTALIALQGPAWRRIWDAVFPDFSPPEGRFRIAERGTGQDLQIVARTGYTGEDGVELWLPNHQAVAVWDRLLAAGATPCGLGARDSLRIEAGLPLYGHELSAEIDPVAGGVGFVVKMDERRFHGREGLQARLAAPDRRGLIGLRALERGVPREGYIIHDGAGRPAGVVTSGSWSPVIDAGIGLGLVDKPDSLLHTEGVVMVRNRPLRVKFVRPPIHRS